MKKNIIKTVFIIFLAMMITTITKAQTYGSWVVAYSDDLGNSTANSLDFVTGAVYGNTLQQFNGQSHYVNSAGGYDQQGNLLFYIVDKQVYDAATNTSVGTFHVMNESVIRPEVQVLRKPGETAYDITTYYIVYSTQSGVGANEHFFYSEVLYDDVNGTISIGDTQVMFYLSWSGAVRGGAFAISKYDADDDIGYIYMCMKAQGIIRYPYTSQGIENSNSELVLDQGNSVIGDMDNFDAHNFEMKVDNDGNTLFAWSTLSGLSNERDHVFVYNMDDDIAHNYDIDPGTSANIGGIEFSTHAGEDNILYVSSNAGSNLYGISKLDYVNGATSSFYGDGFSHTFLQHAPDGNIYAVSNNGAQLGVIDMGTGMFSPNAYSNGNYFDCFISRYGTDFYILPENDGAIFDVLFAHTDIPCEGNENGTGDAIASGGVPGYTYEWSQNGVVFSTLPTATGLAAGTYTCCVTDHDSPPVTICGEITVVVDNGLLPYTQPEEVVIDINSGSQTWSNKTDIFKVGIRVTAGYTLEVNNNSLLQFGPDAKIIIEPTATLTIDNSTLTGHPDCPVMWKGVEVWGNENESQYINPNDGIQHQGKLIINDGVIENAVIAVRLSKGGTWTATTGGIVQANGADFSNNARSLLALNYRNYSPGYPSHTLDNAGYFNNCTFEITNAYIPDVEFFKHIDMNHVDGFKFRGCDFSLQAGVTGVSQWNQGIAAYSAGFDVKATCTSNVQPCSQWDKCTFSGFRKAINANNDGTNTYTFWVNRAEFNDNEIGIYASNVQNLAVLFSEFNIAKNTSDVGECDGKGAKSTGYGIDLTGCTGFAIEENHFAPTASAGTTTGIRIAETEATDEVYKNYFDGLSYGNYAVGKNFVSLLQTDKGLAYYCNENTGNYEDFTIVKNNQLPPIGGIQDPIGSVEMPAGNKFTNNANYNINNDGSYWFGYYYYAPTSGNTSTVYYPDEVYQVTLEEVVGIQNQCLSHYGGPASGTGTGREMVLSPEEKQQTEQEYLTGLTDYNNVKALYDNLKDGGNTEATLSDVETAWPNDMWELRTELLGKSPHLSMDVLKAAADKTNVLPDNVIFEVMAANPDELKKEELIKYLGDKENPLPDYMIDILKQVATGTTYKTVLQRQMAYYNQKKTRAAHDMIRSILNDTITDYVELRNWLDNIGGKRADEQIIATYMQEGNYSDAVNLANMIPALYAYEGNELAEHSYYTEMLNLQITLANEQRGIFDLDSTEVNNLVFIADNSNGTAGAQAKGILEFAYGFHYCDCINADTLGYKSSGSFNPIAFEKMFGVEVSVEPNPAREWAAFNYTLPDSKTEGVIKISDVSGKLVTTLNISGKQGQKVWDTRKIKSGVYFYTLNVSGFNKSGKIVISK
ncbi:MAG: T9SS type A sorting domain-containing protein [Chlorobi bacterium]|nr:T9SS type A sorting domain-containing protein [Chlorobiota bacterium]